MKQRLLFLSLVVMLLGVGVDGWGQATLPHTEVLNYTVGQSLTSQTGWTLVNTSTSDMLITAGSLSYTGLPASTGNKVAFSSSGEDAAKLFTQQTSGTVYYSFLLNVSALGSLNATGGYFTGFNEGTTSDYGGTVWTRLDGTGFDIGINPRTTAANTVWTSGTTAINTTIFIVISYQIVSGSANDIVKLWINPTPGQVEPTATLTATNGGTDLANLNRILLRQDGSTATPSIEIDEIRIGTSWSDVTPSGGNTVPSLTTQAPSAILTTTATGNGNITSTGGVSPTTRGFCWDLAANADPDINDSKSEESGTFTTGAFTGSISGLTAETQYKVRAYATNTEGTGYGSAVSFWTLSPEPSAHTTTFNNTVISQTQIDLTFDAASTLTNADGYIILRKTGSTPTGTPTDGNAYSIGNAIGDGTVAALVTNNSATTANITGLTANTSYYFTIMPYNWNGTDAGTYNYYTVATIPSTNGTTWPNVPTIATTNAATGINQNSATSGGTTLNANGGTISVKGVVWNTTTTPTLPGLGSTSDGSGTANYVSSVTELDPQTLYYVRAYATNEGGTGYGTNVSFRTLSNPPTAQATNLAGTATSSTAINLTWLSASFPESGATNKGYVLLRATSPNTPSLGNGNGSAPTAGANTTIVSYTIAYDATSQSSSSLTANTTYNYLLIPYCWDGTNAATYNYLTASAPTTSAATPSNLSDIIAVVSSETATISSLVNDEPPLTSTSGVQVWQISVRDGGSAMNDGDNLPTIVSGITLTQNAGNAVDNWSDAIKTIALFDGVTWIANASSITTTTIVFSGLNINVADNNSKTLSLRMSVNSTLNNVGSGNLDGDDFVFNITNANFSTLTDGTSSTKASFTTASSANGQNALSVVATKLIYGQQPSNVTINTNISPAVTVKAVDVGNNTDREFVSSVSITSTGSTLTGSPVTSSAALGVATFSTLQLSDAAIGVTLTASYAGLTDAISNSFNVSLPLSAYSYRTLRTGNWNGVSTGSESWERSSDGNNWSTVTSSSDIPNSSAGSITIKSGHTITVSSSTNADELTVEASSQITISSGQTFTIADGTGTDAAIFGVLKNIGTLTNNGQLEFASGSKYEHAINGGAIPTATWDAISTIEVTGSSSTAPTFSSSQTYGNVIWNNSGQSSTLNLVGNLRNIAGNFTIANTNSNILRLNGGTGYTFTIAGNLIINSSTSFLELANGTSSGNVLNIGGWNQTGGSFDTKTGIATVAVNFTGTDVTFSQSAGTLTNTYINWSINNGASLNIASSLQVASNRTFTVNGTLICGETAEVFGAGAFSIASGAILKTAHASGINGSITVSGTKTFSTGANYEFSGTGTQVTGALLPATVNNLTTSGTSDLTLSNAGQLTVSNNLNLGVETSLTIGNNQTVTVSGTLTNNAGASGLVIESDANGTGSLIHSTAGVAATVQRYLTNYSTAGDNKYHLLSSPVSAQPIRPDFVANSPAADVDFYKFDEPTATWINTKTQANAWNADFESNFVVGRGYLVAYPNTPVTKSFTGGTLNSYPSESPLVITCTNTNAGGWNLIGNPFPSAIDWDLVTKGDGMDNALYYYDHDAANYRYYVQLESVGSLGSGSRYIPAMQGFMVHAKTSGTKTVSLHNGQRVHNAQAFYKAQNEINNLLTVKINANGKTDEAYILYFDDATESFDGKYDAYKLFSYAEGMPQLYTFSADEAMLAINTLPTQSDSKAVALGYKAANAGTHSMSFEGLTSFAQPGSLQLEDKLLGIMHTLNDGPYEFVSEAGTVNDRFVLHFGAVGISEQPASATLKAYVVGGQLYFPLQGEATLEIVDLQGRLLQQSKVSGQGLASQPLQLTAGAYVVRLTSGHSVQTAKVIVK